MKKPFQCIEHQKLYKGKDITPKAYDELLKYAMSENGQKIIRPYNGYLKVRNYVGIIQTKSGFVLEILPKTHDKDCCEKSELKKSRLVFIKMLKAIRRLPGYKNIDFANLKKSDSMPLFEIFISMFIDEVFALVKKGIKSDYIAVRENNSFMKGKLVVGEHIKRNIVHKEKFYIEYDQYLPDIPQNRIIKSAVCFLISKSSHFDNIKKLKELAFVFNEVPESVNYKVDYEKSTINRSNKYYELSLTWSMIFLTGSSFSTFSGSEIAWALLFPMEKIFESYLYAVLQKNKCFKQSFDNENAIALIDTIKDLKYQSPQQYLLSDNNKVDKFKLMPDITCKAGNTFFIIDAKWKLLDQNSADGKNGISQTDLYQLLSYSEVLRKHNCFEDCLNIELLLVYPKTDNFKEIVEYNYNIESRVRLRVVPFDLEIV